MDKYEKDNIKEFLKYFPILVISLPFQIAMCAFYLLLFGITFVPEYIRLRYIWLKNNRSWFEVRNAIPIKGKS